MAIYRQLDWARSRILEFTNVWATWIQRNYTVSILISFGLINSFRWPPIYIHGLKSSDCGGHTIGLWNSNHSSLYFVINVLVYESGYVLVYYYVVSKNHISPLVELRWTNLLVCVAKIPHCRAWKTVVVTHIVKD